MFKRDEIRFKAADQDKDGKLSKKGLFFRNLCIRNWLGQVWVEVYVGLCLEYAYFLHPEESPVMRDVVISVSYLTELVFEFRNIILKKFFFV